MSPNSHRPRHAQALFLLTFVFQEFVLTVAYECMKMYIQLMGRRYWCAGGAGAVSHRSSHCITHAVHGNSQQLLVPFLSFFLSSSIWHFLFTLNLVSWVLYGNFDCNQHQYPSSMPNRTSKRENRTQRICVMTKMKSAPTPHGSSAKEKGLLKRLLSYVCAQICLPILSF